MLTIRREQEQALGRAAGSRFREMMRAHISRYFPVDHELLGETQTGRVIDHGVQRAAAHGLGTRGHCCRYIDLILAFGSHFDADPLYPWATHTLFGGDLQDPESTMDQLDELAMEYLGRIMGPSGGLYRRAMLRGRKVSYEELAVPVRDVRGGLTELLDKVYPEKFEDARRGPLDSFLRLSEENAKRHGLGGDPSAVLFHGLTMFMLGSHFARDPLYPWAEEVLEDTELREPHLKGRALYDRTMAYLDGALDLLRCLKER